MKNWQQSGVNYFLSDITQQIQKLPNAIFVVNSDAFGTLSLEKRFDKFDFNHKVYGKDQPFVDRVLKTYKNTNTNLGILLNGIKGTGKSVTAKLICNNFDLPIILVDEPYVGLVDFLSSIEQDIVVMMDEYEKNFGDSNQLLGVMDGIDASPYRRTFVLTTNDSYINNNMLNRPGRIRYLKQFNNLELPIVKEIIDDLLLYREYEDDLITTLKDMTHITIDLLISLIKEINIHNEPVSHFIQFFNVELKNPHFDILEDDGKEVAMNVTLPHGRGSIVTNPNRLINAKVYYEDTEQNGNLLGKYIGFKDGFWNFETELDTRRYIIRKTVLNTFYAYCD